MSIHDFLPPPPAVPPLTFPGISGKLWCFNLEGSHTVKWVASLWGADKLTKKVKADGFVLAKKDHDVGTMIIHGALPPNAGMALSILFSKYKFVFGASTVHAEGAPLATWMPLTAPPIFCSQPCSLPAMTFPLNNIVPLPNTVKIGMTFMDFLYGWANVAFEAAFDLFFNFLSLKTSPEKPLPWIKEFLGERGKTFEKMLANWFYRYLSMVLKPAWKWLGEGIHSEAVRKFGRDLIKRFAKSGLLGILALIMHEKWSSPKLPIIGVKVIPDSVPDAVKELLFGGAPHAA